MSGLPDAFTADHAAALAASAPQGMALLLEKVTKEPAELAILLEQLMFEKVPMKQR